MRIITEKGWLEPLHVNHAEALFELIHNSRSHLYPWLPWLKRIHSVEDSRAFIKTLVEQRGPQFVIHVDHKICGGAGFYVIDKVNHQASLGYWLGQEFIGQGIMRDAIHGLCHHGFHYLNLQRVVIRCAANNLRSRQIPESLGFYFEGVETKAEWLTDHYVDHAVYTMEREEFAALAPRAQMKQH